MQDVFRGELTRVTNEEPAAYSQAAAHCRRDSELIRLGNSDPMKLFSEKNIRDRYTANRVEKGFEPDRYFFSVRTLAEDKLIGYFTLQVNLIHNIALVGIAIEERDFWNKGYGTDMMKVCLRYAFSELGVYGVSLTLHSYNRRALRSYEKAGFRLEGRTRQDILREGERTDTLWMSILREEWLHQVKLSKEVDRA